MRSALVAVLLSACAGAVHETAWPVPHAREVDGGESLAPHEARVVAAVSKGGAEDDKPIGPPATAVTQPAAPAVTTAVTPPATASEEAIQSEEIIIEIDD